MDSKYALAVIAAKRARMLASNEKAKSLMNGAGTKPVTVALQEIAEGKIKLAGPPKGSK